MSHFCQVETKLSHQEYLVTALTELELPPQVFATAQPLIGYFHNQTKYCAEIVIPGSSIKCRADVGFKWNKTTQTYDVIHDEYETGYKLGQNFFSTKLIAKYGECAVRAKVAQLEQTLGPCTITQTKTETGHTLKLVFPAHQQSLHHHRR